MSSAFVIVMGAKFFSLHDHKLVVARLHDKLASLQETYDIINVFIAQGQRGFEDWAYSAILGSFPSDWTQTNFFAVPVIYNSKDQEANTNARPKAIEELFNRHIQPLYGKMLEAGLDRPDVCMFTGYEDNTKYTDNSFTLMHEWLTALIAGDADAQVKIASATGDDTLKAVRHTGFAGQYNHNQVQEELPISIDA